MHTSGVPNPYQFDRFEMVRLVPDSTSSLLDVECANGGFGRAVSVESRGRVRISGIDPNTGRRCIRIRRRAHPQISYGSAGVGSVRLHRVQRCAGTHGRPLGCARGRQELSRQRWNGRGVDPERPILGVLAELTVRDLWEDRDMGILDRTQLRFFTGTTIRSAFESTGFSVTPLESFGLPGCKRFRRARRQTMQRIDPFMTPQYTVVARLDE